MRALFNLTGESQSERVNDTHGNVIVARAIDVSQVERNYADAGGGSNVDYTKSAQLILLLLLSFDMR